MTIDKELIEKWTRESGADAYAIYDNASQLKAFAALVRDHALEECCQMLMDMHHKCSDHNYYHCAANEIARSLKSQP